MTDNEQPTDLPERDKETYIGDGVYASFDGWQIWLRAPRVSGDHRIALDPQVFVNLRDWIATYPRLKHHMGGE